MNHHEEWEPELPEMESIRYVWTALLLIVFFWGGVAGWVLRTLMNP